MVCLNAKIVSASLFCNMQLEEAKQEYREVQQLCYRHRADSMHRAAVISQLEHRLSELAIEKDVRTRPSPVL